MVFISEQQAPDDFVPIWEKEIIRCIRATNKNKTTEKLFIHKSRINEI